MRHAGSGTWLYASCDASRLADQFHAGYAETDSRRACTPSTEDPVPTGRVSSLGPRSALREERLERLEELRPPTRREDRRALRPHCCSTKRSFRARERGAARQRIALRYEFFCMQHAWTRGNGEIGRLTAPSSGVRRPRGSALLRQRDRRSAPVKPRDSPDQQPSPPGRSSPTARSRRRSSMTPRPGRAAPRRALLPAANSESLVKA